MLRKLTESLVFEAFIFLIVCLNTVMLVTQTFAEVEVRGGKGQGTLFTWRRLLMLFQASCQPGLVPDDLCIFDYLILTPGKQTTSLPSVRDEAGSHSSLRSASQPERKGLLFGARATRWRVCSKHAAFRGKGAGNPGCLDPRGVRVENLRRRPLKPWGAG